MTTRRSDLAGMEIIECPYMPKDFIAMKDETGIAVLNLKTGYTFRIPPITLETEMPRECWLSGDAAHATISATVRFNES